MYPGLYALLWLLWRPVCTKKKHCHCYCLLLPPVQMARLSPSEQAMVISARSQQYHSFIGIPDEAFPLFLTSKQWLAMLDATLPEPFLRWACTQYNAWYCTGLCA